MADPKEPSPGSQGLTPGAVSTHEFSGPRSSDGGGGMWIVGGPPPVSPPPPPPREPAANKPAADVHTRRPELVDHLAVLFRRDFWRELTLLGFLRWGTTLMVILVLGGFVAELISSNFRTFIEAHHWDAIFTHSVDAMPELFASHAGWLGVGLIFGSATVLWLIWAFPHRLGDHHTLPKSRVTQWTTAIIALALIGGSFILANSQSVTAPIIRGFTQQQLNDRLNDRLAEATKPLNDRIAQLQAVQQQQLKIGPQKTLAIAKYLANPRNLPSNVRWAIFVTYPAENQEFYATLITFLRYVGDPWSPWIMNAPDDSTDLDAPKFPAPPAESGIILHGDNALNTAITQIFSTCFVVRRTDREIDGLKEWFNKRLSEPERAENRQVTWLEIGHGSPWRQGNRLSPDCFR
jgi:hypothetical protein